MPIPDVDKLWAKLDETGESEVRIKLASGVYHKSKVPLIQEWLRRREERGSKMNVYEEAMNFERKVAAIFRALGAKVEHDVSLAGNQIDILVSEETPSGSVIKSAIECKYYSRPLGVDLVNSFAGLAVLLKNRGIIDKALLVARSGFTHQARAAAKEHGIELHEIADLEQRLVGKENLVVAADAEMRKEQAQQDEIPVTQKPRRAFVVMPFDPEFNDIYILGIREVAEKLGIVVERADDVEHNQSIPDLIKERILKCDVVIAETSKLNPNVFYEVGLAHGVQKETILLCRDVKSIPFDLGSINHLVYSSIVELRERLEKRIRTTLGV
jgi:hypothetical protein